MSARPLDLLLALGAAALSTAAHAQSGAPQAGYPVRPIRLIVPYFPGGTPDIQGRLLAEKLRERFGQPVIVDNRPGANASIGMGLVAKAPADGYTMVIAPVGPWTVNPHMYKLPYDVFRDFAPIIHVSTSPGVLAVHPSVPAKSVADVIDLARAKPGALNYGSTGVGGFGHISGELFNLMAGVKMTHVPHKSVAAALTALAGGHIELSFNVAATTLPHIQSGRIRALAVTSAARIDTMPDLPTIAEAGVPGYENSTWNAIAVPAGTPRQTIATLNREIAAILKMPEVRQAMYRDGAIVTGGTPEEFTAQLKTEFAKYGKLIKQAGIKYE